MSCRLDKTGDNLVGDSKPLGQITLERRGLSPIVYHVTTPKKLARIIATGCILSPVFFWPTEEIARDWGKRKQRTVILSFKRPGKWYPLPAPRHAYWTSSLVHEWLICP